MQTEVIREDELIQTKALAKEYPTAGVHKFVVDFINSLGLGKGHKAIDCPAGDGRASYVLSKLGVQVQAYDLNPEKFRVKAVSCKKADLCEGFPEPDGKFDFAICEEGIEHMPDQLKVLLEFNRVLKVGGGLLVSCPSPSHYRARLSYLLSENEYHKFLPASEVDSVWFSPDHDKLFYGHVFLPTAQRLRTLGVFAGFELRKVCWTDLGVTSFIMFPLVYPFAVYANLRAYRRNSRGKSDYAKKILWDVVKLNLNPAVLLSKHHLFYFVKKHNPDQITPYLKQFSS